MKEELNHDEEKSSALVPVLSDTSQSELGLSVSLAGESKFVKIPRGKAQGDPLKTAKKELCLALTGKKQQFDPVLAQARMTDRTITDLLKKEERMLDQNTAQLDGRLVSKLNEISKFNKG